MHIVLANRWYPPHSGYGGVAMYNYYLAHALTKIGHRVTIVTSRTSADVPAVERDGEIVVHRLLTHYHYRLHHLPVIGRYMRPLDQARYSARVARKLLELERKDPFDAVEFADVNAEGWIYLHRCQRLPVVVRCHTPTFVLRHYYRPQEIPYDTGLITRMEKQAIRRADALTAPSADMARTVAHQVRLEPQQISVIPNGLDLTLFNTGDNALISEDVDRELIVLHVGRLERIKGIEVIAEAIPLIVNRIPKIRFVFVGGGNLWQHRLEAIVKKRGVEAAVSFAGPVDRSTLIHWYQRADIAIVPTLNYESFSYTCAQAMAAGLPLVASRIGGIPETVGDDNVAILVEPGDVQQLANAVLELASDPVRRGMMGQAGKRRAENCFSAPLVAQRMAAFYKAVLN